MKIKVKEWLVLKAACDSLTIGDIIEKTGLKPYSVTRVLNRLREKVFIGFQPNYRKMGLLPIAIITRISRTNLPPFTVADRRLYGSTRKKDLELITAVPPEKDTDLYLSLLSCEPEYVICGYEYVFWHPNNARLTLYNEAKKNLTPKLSKIDDILDSYRRERPKKYPPRIETIDEIDLEILKEKQEYAFKKLREISRIVGISHQVLSYHFRKHVRKLWAGNRIGIYLNASAVPFRVYIFEGKDAPALAKTLVKLPYFHSAFIDEKKACVIAQPSDFVRKHLSEVISETDVYMPFGELIMELKMKRRIPGYIRFFKKGKWILPVEEYLKAERS